MVYQLGTYVDPRPLENSAFEARQKRLPAIIKWPGSVADGTTVVVVPSLTLHDDELRKIAGAIHFEERLLFLLQMLRQPHVRIVYVVSEPLDQALIDYALDLASSVDTEGAASRLTVLSCNDAAPVPLTLKVMKQPALISSILQAIPDIERAYLATYNSTPLERNLAMLLGIPLYACDPALSHLGTKSGARRLFREADVPIPTGVEDVGDRRDLTRALGGLKLANPGLRRAMIKLNDSFAGGGNAIYSFAAAPAHDIESWVAASLRDRLVFAAAGETFDDYLGKIAEMGGVVEEFVDAPQACSPSVQLEIDPGGRVRVLSTHDQIFAGAVGQVFVGCTFPAGQAYRAQIRELALRAGESLATQGVIGQLSIDFVVHEATGGFRALALEVNLRMGGATTPYFLLQGLADGRYEPGSGDYVVSGGEPRHYVASDRIQSDCYRRLRPHDVIGLARTRGLHYDRSIRKGVAFYMLGALRNVGKLGMVAIGETPDESRQLYDAMLGSLDELSSEQPSGSTSGAFCA